MKFVLVRCPEGIIGTIVCGVDLVVDKSSSERRGYVLIEDFLAKRLTERPGYEAIPLESYPREINQLPRYTRDQASLRHVVLNLDGTVSNPEHAVIENRNIPSAAITADFYRNPCLFCKLQNRIKQMLRIKN